MLTFIVGLNYGNVFNICRQCNNNSLTAGGYNPAIGTFDNSSGLDQMGGLMNAVNYLDNYTDNNAYGLNFNNNHAQQAQQPLMNQNNDMFGQFMTMMMSFMMNIFSMMMQSMMGNQNPMAQGNNLFTGNNTANNPLGNYNAGNILAGNNYTNPAGNYGNATPVANNAPPLNLANVQGSALGQQIAQSANQTANSLNSQGWCAKGVRMALEKVGINGIGAASAYMVADQLAKHQKFKEVQVSRDQLKSLPAGAIVVWGQSAGHQHGHISVALGDGREASDHVQGQITGMAGSTLRVFIPVG
jgi:hypothetical protein